MAEQLPLYDSLGPNDIAVPQQLPADKVLVTDYRVMPWPDGTRVTVEMGVTQFRVFPAMDVLIANTLGDVVRMASLVGGIERRPAPTLFLPQLARGTPLLAVVEMIDKGECYQRIEVPFEVAGPIIKHSVDAHD